MKQIKAIPKLVFDKHFTDKEFKYYDYACFISILDIDNNEQKTLIRFYFNDENKLQLNYGYKIGNSLSIASPLYYNWEFIKKDEFYNN